MGRNSASKRRNKIKSANIRSPIDFSFLPKAIASIQLTKSTKRYANRSTSEEAAVNNDGGSSTTNKEATVKSEDEGCSHGSSEWHSNCEGHIKDRDDEKVGELQKNRISAGSTTAQKPGDTGTKDSFEEKKMSEGDALQKMPERGGVTNHNNASTVHLSAINVGADLVHCESMEQHLVSNQIQTRACGQKASISARNNSQHDGCTSQVGVIKEAKEKLSAVSTSMEGPEVVSKGLNFNCHPYYSPPVSTENLNSKSLTPICRLDTTSTITHTDTQPVVLGCTASATPAPNFIIRVGSDLNTKTQPVRIWAPLHQETPSDPINLAHANPRSESEKKSIALSKDICKDGEALGRGWIVGHFIKHKLPYTLVKNTAEKLWGKYGLVDVLTMDKGFFLFKFKNAKGSKLVLEGCSWHVAGKLVVVRPWELLEFPIFTLTYSTKPSPT
ncbi:hypothetical protein HYC85_021915 [Camellia sinensis]|uniref:DUF4283 domain-containing protein n=1 Tax=Camellia sinensis TaxID=4442 RepID=A0A7J7GMX2_CAMSI|nr:hypothetical protein HYC85_021915 [Camellia sinensis]